MKAKYLGRRATVVFLAAVFLLVVLTLLPPLFMLVGPVHVVDWVGLLIFAGAAVAWFTAIYHWARYFPREGPRRTWGLVVVLGFLPGAIVYWWRGFRHAEAKSS